MLFRSVSQSRYVEVEVEDYFFSEAHWIDEEHGHGLPLEKVKSLIRMESAARSNQKNEDESLRADLQVMLPTDFTQQLEPIELNKTYNESNCDTMSRMPDNFIDLTVTSPPYDNLRLYEGYEWNFERVAQELFRVTKQGGIVVWVVGDATIKGSETLTSFKQAIYFRENCGFNLHDTMIWEKTGRLPTQDRYYNVFEYMFIFSKGKPKTLNFICDSKTTGWVS